MRISDWSSDVCSSDLLGASGQLVRQVGRRDGLVEDVVLVAVLDRHVVAQAAVGAARDDDGNFHAKFDEGLDDAGGPGGVTATRRKGLRQVRVRADEIGSATCYGRGCHVVRVVGVGREYKEKIETSNTQLT